MADGRRGAALDLFRLAAVMLVVANHTSPLVSVSPLWDFWFTRVLARVAVPFFLMVSGYFLAKDQWRRTGVFLKKTCLLYGAAVLLYLPLNWYNGGYGPAEWVKKLLLDGTFYHLWYFPGVILGVLVARGLLRLGPRTALTAAGLLYLVGLGGDSLLWTDLPAPGAGGAVRGDFPNLCLYAERTVFHAAIFAAGSRRCAVEREDLRCRPVRRLRGHDRRGALAPWASGPAARQHVHAAAAGDGLPVFPSAGAESRREAELPQALFTDLCPAPLVHRAGPGRRGGAGPGRSAGGEQHGAFPGRAGLQRGGVLGAVAGLEQTAAETLQ